MYTYSPLPTDSAIRLLTLFPGKNDAELCGSLHSTALENAGEYEALSYAWGSPEQPFTMTVDGDQLRVTESLHTALRQLRQPDGPRVMWIDAICINQADLNEKSTQVSFMNKVFSSARRVVCWLGEDPPLEGHTFGLGCLALRLLKTLANSNFSMIRPGQITNEFMETKGLPPQENACWYAVSLLFRRPWFRRVWIIQEFVLASDAVIVCGDSQLHWRTFAAGVDLLHGYTLHRWGTSPHGETADVTLNAFQAMTGLKRTSSLGEYILTTLQSFAMKHHSIQRLLDDEGIPAMQELISSVREAMQGQDVPIHLIGHMTQAVNAMLSAWGIDPAFSRVLPLFSMNMTFANSIATDPRDRFFALVGLSRERNEPSLRPDYTEPFETTAIRFSRFYSLHPEPYGKFLMFAGRSNHSENLDLPSWTFDPSNISVYLSSFIASTRAGESRRSAGSTACSFRTTTDTRTLYVTGCLVDTIARIIPQPCLQDVIRSTRNDDPGIQEIIERVSDAVQRFFHEMDRITIHRKTRYPYLAQGESLSDVLWRTLIANADGQGLPPQASYRDSYLEDRPRLMTSSWLAQSWETQTQTNVPGMVGDWARKWLLLCPAYSVCETMDGLIGLVPNGTRVGDSVCVLLGQDMPFVMRPTRREDPMEFQLWGACYVHGIMDGEALISYQWRDEEFRLV